MRYAVLAFVACTESVEDVVAEPVVDTVIETVPQTKVVHSAQLFYYLVEFPKNDGTDDPEANPGLGWAGEETLLDLEELLLRPRVSTN
ncbi:MAG: hypothetical protein GY747_08820 [Planctomycetes bacterium]|nr:hypothetical protein [Planctomycetota bacterium]MCP4771289.1 hypothetical protein [Planctomycetota bacterium]MCP4860479.1 hypothetical protein [Planctomycetota bacterium]